MKKFHLATYRDWSFKKKLLVIISALLTAIVIFISFFSYILYSDNFTRQTVNQTQQIIEQVAINIDTYLDELFRLNLSPYYNDTIMEELEDEYNTHSFDLYRKRSIENFLASVMILPRSEILRVYILTDNYLYSYTRTPYDMGDYNNYKDTDWYKQAIKSSTPVFVPNHPEKIYGDKPTRIFSIAQRIRSKEDNSKVLAVIKVDANYSGIKTICDKVQLKEKGSLFILDASKNIVYENNQLEQKDLIDNLNFSKYKNDGSYPQTIASKKYLINVATLKTTGFKVIAVNSYEELTRTARMIRNLIILLAFICLLLAVMALFLFIQRFLKPLFKIVHLMKQVQEGNLSVQVEIKNNDEIGYLADSFNHMIRQIREILDRNTQLVKEIYESRYLQKEAQYNILCSQIKPHFLYNTLNTISLLIKCRDYNGAILSIEKLSFFLRGIMNTDKIIPLSAELDIIDSYLGIQRARFGDNLSYLIDISGQFKTFMLPALTLQPIVENAVIHGCEEKRGKSFIHIYSTADANCLRIHVTDNGAGIEENTLKELLQKLSPEDQSGEEIKENTSLPESIGLINVNKRIKLRYGEEYGLDIVSSPLEGTHVTITLPYPEK